MTFKVLEIVSITLATLVFGVFWGPWLALSRSIGQFTSEVFLIVVHRMDRNLAPVMTFLLPAALVSIAGVVVAAIPHHGPAFVLSAGAFALFVLTAVVTVVVEVPIVIRIRGWAVTSMPADWTVQRDRWVAFHLVRVAAGAAGVLLLVAGVVF